MKAAYHSTHLFSLLLVLVHEFYNIFASADADEGWGEREKDFLNDFQWLSHISIWHINQKILIKKNVRRIILLLLSNAAALGAAEQLNDLAFLCRIIYIGPCFLFVRVTF